MQFPHEWYLIVEAWLALGVTFLGLGALVRRACGAAATDAAGWLTSFWLGWALATFVLQLWQLVLPIDVRIAVGLAAAGVLGIAASGGGPWRVLWRGLRTSLPALLVFAVVAGWLANRALGGPMNGDTGLYHIPTIEWLMQYPIVPGLGNLYVAYAFNHSSLLYLALLELGPFVHGSHHIGNGILLLVLFGHVLLGITATLRKGPCRTEHLFYALCLPAAVALVFNYNYTSPSPDFPVFVLGFVLTGQLLRVLDATAQGPAPRFDLLAVIMLAALGLTIKMSMAGLAVFSVLVALVAWLRHGRAAERNRIGTLAVALFLGTLGVVPWMIRGIIMSGYPFYPSTVGGVELPWRIPPDAATWVLGVSQIPGPYSLAYTNPQWFLTVLSSLGWTERDVVLPLAIAGAMAIVAVVLRLFRRGQRTVSLVVILPALAQFVFLFLAAPRARYGGAVFWLLAIETALLVLGSESRGRRVLGLVAAVALAGLPFHDSPEIVRHLRGFELMPQAGLVELQLETGLKVQYPGVSQTCWDGPLPCTPEPLRGLRLRRDGDLRSGFVIDPAYK